MPVITLNNIHKAFGNEIVFEGIDARLYPGEKVGVLGPNGCGKTTIFKMIVGIIEPDVGTIHKRKGLKIGYLPQEPVFDGTKTVLEEMYASLEGLFGLQDKMEKLSKSIESLHGKQLQAALEDYDRICHAFETSGGFTYESKCKTILAGLGFDESMHDLNTAKLSGGQMSRLGLGKVLLADTDVLLLDEPTNHLDLQAVEWLENYLRNYTGAVAAISHDRYLLDSLACKILEIDNSNVTVWKGNYSDYVKNREIASLERERNVSKKQAEIEKTEDFIKRNINFKGMQKIARGRRKQLERMLKEEGRPEEQAKQKSIDFSFSESRSRSDLILRCEKLGKSFGDLTLFENVTFDILCGERVGITGPNGTGKSTFIKMALGQVGDYDGEMKLGETLKVGYLDQCAEVLDPDNSVLDEVKSVRPDLKDEALRGVLGAFLFSGDDAFKRVGDLSGGQQNRLMLCRLVLQEPDILVLDEPTNHLDIAGKEILEKAICDFNGAIIVVSHDRYFLDAVADKLLVIGADEFGKRKMGASELIEGEKAYTKYSGLVRERREKQQQKETVKNAPADRNTGSVNQPKNAAPPEIKKFNKYRIEEIEEMIMETEEKIEKLQAGFADEKIYKDHKQSAKLHADINELKNQRDLLYKAYEFRG